MKEQKVNRRQSKKKRNEAKGREQQPSTTFTRNVRPGIGQPLLQHWFVVCKSGSRAGITEADNRPSRTEAGTKIRHGEHGGQGTQGKTNARCPDEASLVHTKIGFSSGSSLSRRHHLALLRIRGGREFASWLCWSEGEQGYADDTKHQDAERFPARDQVIEYLNGHNRGVSKTRPRREGDQAAIRGGVARGKQQENPQRGIHTQHHPQGLFQMHGEQRVSRNAKEQSHHHQNNLQNPLSNHRNLRQNLTDNRNARASTPVGITASESKKSP